MSLRFVAELHQQLDDWIDEGILTAEQAQSLRRRHPLPAENEDDHRVVRILAWIGGVLAAVGVVLFVATNWTKIPHALRILMLAATTAALMGAGAWRLRARDEEVFGSVLLFLGGVAYGGTLMQVGNTFHLPAHHSGLVSLWTLGILPLAYVLRNRGLHLLAVLLVPYWVLATFLIDGPIQHVRTGAAAFQAAGLVLIGAGLLHPREGEPGRLPPFGTVSILAGTFFVFLPAFVLTFFDKGSLRALEAGEGVVSAGLILLWLAAAAALVAGAAWTARSGGPWWLRLAPHTLAVALSAAVLILEPIPLNWVYAVAVVALLPLAVLARDEPLFNLGVVLFIIEVGGRYVEFLVDYRNPWVAFLVGGAVLLALAYGLSVLHRYARRRIRTGPEGAAGDAMPPAGDAPPPHPPHAPPGPSGRDGP